MSVIVQVNQKDIDQGERNGKLHDPSKCCWTELTAVVSWGTAALGWAGAAEGSQGPTKTSQLTHNLETPVLLTWDSWHLKTYNFV